MKIDVYEVRENPDPLGRYYVLVPSGKDIQELKEKFGYLEWEKTIDMNPGEKRIAVNTDEALKNIQTTGYYINNIRIASRIQTT